MADSSAPDDPQPKPRRPRARSVVVTDDTLEIFLDDDDSVRVPVFWYPRLTEATAYELGNWRILGDGEGIYWPDLDEDVRVEALLDRRRSDESPESFRMWRRSRR